MLATTDGRTARCTVHGGEYQILFSRWREPFAPPPLPPLATTPSAPQAEEAQAESDSASPRVAASGAGPPLERMSPPGTMCAQHPRVPAVVTCRSCARPLCATCAFQDVDGTQLCLDCIAQNPAAHRTDSAPVPPPTAPGFTGAPEIPAAPTVPKGVYCVQHPHVQATGQCQSCGAFMCTTCDFLLPGGIHLCPACATAPRTHLSARRRNLVAGSYALAVWSSLVMALLLGGGFASMTNTRSDTRMLDVALHFLLLVPSLVGTALAVSALERRLGNPPGIWVAAGWNGLILGGYVLLTLIGLLSG